MQIFSADLSSNATKDKVLPKHVRHELFFYLKSQLFVFFSATNDKIETDLFLSLITNVLNNIICRSAPLDEGIRLLQPKGIERSLTRLAVLVCEYFCKWKVKYTINCDIKSISGFMETITVHTIQ